MTAHVHFTRSAARSCAPVAVAVMLLAGCDQFGTPPADDEPEPARQVVGPPPVDVTPVVPRTPQQIIDEFLALSPSLRTDDQLRELSGLEDGLEQITELDLRQSGVSDEGVAVLSSFGGLTRLDLSGSRVTSGVTEHLVAMPALEELILNSLPLEDDSLALLSELPALRSISLSGTAVSENCFLHLAACESLESLTVDNNERLLGNGFSELLRRREFSTLRELSVNHTGFGYHGFNELNHLSELEALRAADAEVTDPVLDGIRSCTALRTLVLSENSLTDAAFQRLSRLSQLEELDVGGCPAITDVGLRLLRSHDQLQRLSLRGTSCSLAGATDLKEKFLENTTIVVADREL